MVASPCLRLACNRLGPGSAEPMGQLGGISPGIQHCSGLAGWSLLVSSPRYCHHTYSARLKGLVSFKLW